MSTRDEKIRAVEEELLTVRAELKRLSDRMDGLFSELARLTAED